MRKKKEEKEQELTVPIDLTKQKIEIIIYQCCKQAGGFVCFDMLCQDQEILNIREDNELQKVYVYLGQPKTLEELRKMSPDSKPIPLENCDA